MKHDLIKRQMPNLEGVEVPNELSTLEARFVLNVIQGYGPNESYRMALGKHAEGKTPTQVASGARRVRKSAPAQQYMRALLKELERVAVVNAFDLELFLSAAVCTPIGGIDENHPLCQEKTTSVTTHKDGSTTEKTNLKSVSKLEAAKMLIRMKGLDAPIKIDVDHRVGVMVVPMASSVDEWEQLAANSQKKLMEDAVNID